MIKFTIPTAPRTKKNNQKQCKLGKGVPFERIRRITGYLVGSTDKWGDAKRHEEKDRVKHGIGGKG